MKYLSYFFFLLILSIIPLKISAKSIDITNEKELQSSLLDNNINEINLLNDISIQKELTINHNITLNGNNYSITYAGNNTEDNYILNIKDSQTTIKNIKLQNGYAGILLDNSIATLEGMIDITNNLKGGIKLEGKNALLYLDKEIDLINTLESEEYKTIWGENTTYFLNDLTYLKQIKSSLEKIPFNKESLLALGCGLIIIKKLKIF